MARKQKFALPPEVIAEARQVSDQARRQMQEREQEADDRRQRGLEENRARQVRRLRRSARPTPGQVRRQEELRDANAMQLRYTPGLQAVFAARVRREAAALEKRIREHQVAMQTATPDDSAVLEALEQDRVRRSYR